MAMNAIWIDLPDGAMNVAAVFRLALDLPDGATIRIAAADAYRLWIDGRLAAHGPARTAHGYARVDEIKLVGHAGGRAVLVVEVHSARVPGFDLIDQPPFFAAEVVAADSRVIATASDFEAHRDGTLVQRVRRYSFQRGFVESRRLAADPGAFRRGGDALAGYVRAGVVPAILPNLLPRAVPYPALLLRDAGEPVSRGTVLEDPSATPPPRREVSLVGSAGFKGFPPNEWEDDSAADAARLVGQAAIDVAERDVAPNDAAPEAAGTPDFSSETPTSSAAPSQTPREAPYVLYDFRRTLTGFFSLKVRAAAPIGATILLAYDERRAPEDAPFPVNPLRGSWTRVVKWRLAPGKYDLLTFHPASARFAAVATIEGEAEIRGFGIVDYENPDASRVALPPCGDAELDAIVSAARATFAQNAVDMLTDCPSRERAAYSCDNFFQSRAEALFTGRSIIERATLENYALGPQSPFLPKGMIPMCYPADHTDGVFIPTFALWWILELAQYRERTGDESVVALSRRKLEDVLDWFSPYVGPEGLLEDLPGWVFVEWSACSDKDHVVGANFPSNFLYASALESAAVLLGRPDLAAQGAAVRETAARLAWNGEWFEDNAVRDGGGRLRRADHVTETGQYYAFYFGAASPESNPALWERLCAEFGPRRDAAKTYPDIPPSNAIVGAYLRLELLLRHGRAAQCLDECRLLFAPMARLTGTLWENLSPNSSLNHGFAASAAWLIMRALGGEPTTSSDRAAERNDK